MTSKEALKELSMMINREKHINSEWNRKIKNLTSIIERDLEILEIQQLISKNTIKKIREEGMEEIELPKAPNTFEALNYLEKMANKYQMIRYPGVSNLTIDGYCEQIKQDLEQLENLKTDLKYMQDKGVQSFMFHNGTIILGFDITNSPYQQEIRKEILEDTINNMLGVFKNE